MDFKNLRTIRQLAAEAKAQDPNTFLTEGKLRWWVYNAETNGLKVAIVRVGGRIFFDKEGLNQWLDSLRGTSTLPEPTLTPLPKLRFEDK